MGSTRLDKLRGGHDRQISVHSSIERKSEELDEDRKRYHRPKLSVSVSSVRGRPLDLVPAPSNDPLDPLNWPRWKKELAYASLLTLASTVGVLKMVLVPVVTIVASEFSCSYMAAASLTGVPFLLGASSALVSSMLGRKVGKRGLLLVGAVLMFVGAMWNMHILDVYAEFMCARCFQGVGWGLVEGVLAESISDMFFVHQRGLRMNVLDITNVFFTWATPIIGGYISYSHLGWRDQFMFSSIIQATSLLLLTFGTPESAYYRCTVESPTLPPGSRSLHQVQSTTITTVTTQISPIQKYLSSLYVFSPKGDSSKSKNSDIMLPLKALGAPTTVLSALLSAPILATAFGIAHIISLVLSPAPAFLRPERIGYLFVLPATFAFVTQLALVVISYFGKYNASSGPSGSSPSSNSPMRSLIALSFTILAVLLAAGGIVGFTFYTTAELSPQDVQATLSGLPVVSEEIMSPSCLWIAGCLFALLVVGCSTLAVSGEQTLSESQELLGEGQEHGGTLLRTATLVHQESLIGMFISGFPLWVQSKGTGIDQLIMGWRAASVGLAIAIFVCGLPAGIILWLKTDRVRKLDKKILGIKEVLDMRWKDDGSFFEP